MADPRNAAWEAAFLPLNYARDGRRLEEAGEGGRGWVPGDRTGAAAAIRELEALVRRPCSQP